MQDMNDMRMHEYLDDLDAQAEAEALASAEGEAAADVEAQEQGPAANEGKDAPWNSQEYRDEMAKLAAETVPDGYRLVKEGKAGADAIYFDGYYSQSWRDKDGQLFELSAFDAGTDVSSFWAVARPVEADNA